ncbi:hypothetical protein C7C46_27815 [Streptomyces tateyamensis]|uniref:Uncharacterized protein n=1 Tax=Streptomyces tateyamensis TaxID=565073 RepID=A0A2V4MV33_9ACTN|nr:hypothetical protein [Streptomyces tateyamensis]PYC69776.1 hypothetical protein C7C46_27815 [Streptomyces tateyamensis]
MTRSPRRPNPSGHPNPPGGRFRPADQVVLVVILVLAAVLTVARVPATTVLELLTGAGAVATGLLQRRPAHGPAPRRRHR